MTRSLAEWMILRAVLIGFLCCGVATVLPLILIGALWDLATGDTGHCPDRRDNPYNWRVEA